MRRALALCLVAALLLGGAPARADEPRPVELARLLARQRTARIERNVGWALSFVGVAAAVFGAAMLVYTHGFGSAPATDGQLESTGGAAALGAGLLLLVPATVLAVHGQQVMSDVGWRLRALHATAFIAPLADGAVAGARLRF
jgi:hypothetical protein